MFTPYNTLNYTKWIVDGANEDAKRTKDYGVKRKYYAVTTQKEDFEDLDPKKILSLGKVLVYKDGEYNQFLSDNWAMFIENVLPSALSNFFFFDGEKLEDYVRKIDFKDIERIEVTRDKASANGDRIITIKKKGTDVPIEIRIDKHNCIIGYTNMDLKEVGDSFLLYNKKIQHLSLPMLEKTGINFLGFNSALRKLSLPKLKEVGKGFLFGNRFLEKLELPSLEEAADDFLSFNEGLRELELPSLTKAGDKFLR